MAKQTSDRLTPEQRTLRARLAAYRLHAAGKTNTAPAREAFAARFYAGIPDDLPQAERDRRAAWARKAYFAELALKSSRARSRKAA
jgi:hypothetical protein